MTAFVHDQVGGLHVAVDDVELVGVFQGVGRLGRQGRGGTVKEGRAAGGDRRQLGRRRLDGGRDGGRLGRQTFRPRRRKDGVGAGRVVFRPRLTRLQLADQVGEVAALDQLHGVVMGAALAADGEDRHDVGVVQLRRRLGLVLETLQLAGVQCRRERQHLEGDATAQRQLHRLVDDAHAAAADLADDVKIAEGFDGRRIARRRARRRTRPKRAGAVDHVEGVEIRRQRSREVGEARRELGAIRTPAGLQRREIFLGRADQARVLFHRGVGAVGRRVHVAPPMTCRSRARPRIQSFSTLSWLRPMRRATSGNVSPSRWRSTSTSR